MKKMLMLIASCVFLLSGCTKSNIVAPSLAVEPETEIKEGLEIDWAQVGQALDETFIDPELYPMGVSINYSIDPDQKYAQLTVVVKEDTTPEDAAAYATEVAKGMNDEVATQDFSYERSTADSYGGFFKEYTVQVMAFPDGVYFEEDKCILNVTIPAGEYVEIKPNA